MSIWTQPKRLRAHSRAYLRILEHRADLALARRIAQREAIRERALCVRNLISVNLKV